jgi:WD40 repeat protein
MSRLAICGLVLALLGAEPRVDALGDPLPEGAVARLGTGRLSHQRAAALAFSPDGKSLASIGLAGEVRVWEAATGRLTRSFQTEPIRFGFGRGVAALVFSPDGKHLAVASGLADVYLHDLTAERQATRTLPPGRFISALAFSPDGRLLAYGGGGPTGVWDMAAGKLVGWIGQDLSYAAGLAFSDADTLCALVVLPGKDRNVGPYGAVRWQARTGKELQRIAVADGYRQVADVCPDGKLFVLSSDDERSLILGDLLTGKELRRTQSKERLGGEGRPVELLLAFSGDGRRMAGLGPDGVVYLWDTATGRVVARLGRASADPYCLALSPDGARLAWAQREENAIRIRGLAEEREALVFSGHRAGPLTVAFAGREVVSVNDGSNQPAWSLRRWGLDGKQLAVTANDLGGPVHLTAFSPEGALLATVPRDGMLRLWDTRTGRELRRWQTPISTERTFGMVVERSPWPAINDLAFSSDGRFVYAAGGQQIHRWDTATGRELTPVPVPRATGVLSCQPTPDGRGVLVLAQYPSESIKGSPPRAVFLPLPGSEPLPLGEADVFGSLTISPDGRTAVVLTREEVTLVEVATGQVRSRSGGQRPTHAAFSPDGRALAVGYANGDIVLLAPSSGRQLARFASGQGMIHSLSFSPDGRMLVSGGYESFALVWDTGSALAAARAAGPGLAPGELEGLWGHLLGADAEAAFRALGRLALAPQQSVPFLRERLKGPPVDEQKRVAALIADLDSDDFAAREKATAALEALRARAAAALVEAEKQSPSKEVRRRAAELLERLTSGRPLPSPEVIAGRVLEALELSGSSEARRLFADLAAGPPEAFLTREAAAALKRLGAGE